MHCICRIALGVVAGALVLPARAANSDATLSWGQFDNKDVLTGEVKHEFASQVTFSDGNILQAFARCGQTGLGNAPSKYPGLVIVFGTFQGDSRPLPYAWQNKKIQLPLLVNGNRRPDVHAYSETPQANLITIGFYDQAAAKRATQQDVPPILRQIEAGRVIGDLKNAAAWDNFVAGTGGTILDLLQATSIRVQFPVADGSANVAEINPQDPILKDYVQRCNSGFQSKTLDQEKKAAAEMAQKLQKLRPLNLKGGELFEYRNNNLIPAFRDHDSC
jgi:hypothetical protein